MICKVAKGSGGKETASKEKASTKSMSSNMERKRHKVIPRKMPNKQFDNVTRKGVSKRRTRPGSTTSKATSNKHSIVKIE